MASLGEITNIDRLDCQSCCPAELADKVVLEHPESGLEQVPAGECMPGKWRSLKLQVMPAELALSWSLVAYCDLNAQRNAQ
ncbi:hypothetical protein [Pseudomonas putida]|uniref:hypothetical protein n=1 Tax=Pseudomonas putida TaxID=303 RepID=UPI0015E1AA4A|nr:hypothetical protein [Pseudomonas putida]